MARVEGVRERARAEITAAIKSEARRQLAEEGAAKLSLRAVARELGMVSSALYRYVPSRDALLTALIIDAYNSIGAAAEVAAGGAGRDAAGASRWLMVCRAVREWALAHPHEYALLYGSPVPGYHAPAATTGPASRVGRVLIAIACEAHEAGTLREPASVGHQMSSAVHADLDVLAERLDVALPHAVMARLVSAWAELFGLLSFEMFGHFTNVVGARADFFDRAVMGLAHDVGLEGEEAFPRSAPR